MLKTSYKIKDDVTIVSFSGDLDMNSIGKAYDMLSEIMDMGYVKVVYDLAELEFIDSTGLGFFTGSLKKLKEKNGDLKIASPSSYLKRIFSLIHMDYFIGIFETVDKAIEKYKASHSENLSKWEEVVRVNPTYADAHYQLALAYKNEGMIKKAMRETTTAIEINNKYSKAFKLRGDLFVLEGNVEKALENYHNALSFSPGFFEAKLEIAILKKEEELLKEVESNLLHAIKDKPDYADLNNYLGRVYSVWEKYDDAIRYFDNALHINPNFSEALYNKALTIMAENPDNIPKAISILKKAFKVSKQKFLRDKAKEMMDELEK